MWREVVHKQAWLSPFSGVWSWHFQPDFRKITVAGAFGMDPGAFVALGSYSISITLERKAEECFAWHLNCELDTKLCSNIKSWCFFDMCSGSYTKNIPIKNKQQQQNNPETHSMFKYLLGMQGVCGSQFCTWVF